MFRHAASWVPDRIGPYRVLARLASGGMAELYVARREDAVHARSVVIKRPLAVFAGDADVVAAVVDEGRILSRLRHPNVVAFHELAYDDDRMPYLVVEHLAGDSLARLSRAVRAQGLGIDPGLAVYLVAEICAGLHAAHELRDPHRTDLCVIHRDVSPQNVIVTFDGEVKVIDFGIARCEDRSASLTPDGSGKGTLGYLAPESVSPEPVDRRADVFAAGVVLHELLSGPRLFERDTDAGTLGALLFEPIPTPRERDPGAPISDALSGVVMRALARDPTERFQSAAALREALRALLPMLDPLQHARERLATLAQRALPEQRAQACELMERAREPSSSRSLAPIGTLFGQTPTARVASHEAVTRNSVPRPRRLRGGLADRDETSAD